ncbi:MAG: alkaline phosphatase family protein, partial [Bacteroidota bacterium]
NIFLSLDAIRARGLELQAVEEEVARFILSIPGVHESFTGSLLRGQGTLSPIGGRVQLGYHQRLSGDVIYTLQPGWIEYGMMGTTHGSPYAYDTHVPALFYGFGVKAGTTWRPYTICDLAPTVAAICRIPLPNACIGQPITELIR